MADAPVDDAAVTTTADDAVRGTLTVADRAVQRIAEAAAQVPGTTRACTGALAGRDLPRASAHVQGTWARVDVDVALAWPAPAAATARRVRDAVTADLDRWAGLRARVDVHLVAVQAAEVPTRERVR